MTNRIRVVESLKRTVVLLAFLVARTNVPVIQSGLIAFRIRTLVEAVPFGAECGSGVAGEASRSDPRASATTRSRRMLFLLRAVINRLLAGNLRADVRAAVLTATDAVDASWMQQERLYSLGKLKRRVSRIPIVQTAFRRGRSGTRRRKTSQAARHLRRPTPNA